MKIDCFAVIGIVVWVIFAAAVVYAIWERLK